MKKLFIVLIVLCSISSNLHAQSWLWGRQGISDGAGDGWAIAIDTSRNVYQTGLLSGNCVYGSYNVNTANESAFLIKYDRCGNILWAKASLVDHLSFSFGLSVAVDKMNNPVVAGFFTDTVLFGSFKLTSQSEQNYDFFLTKYDALGNVLWAEQSQIPSTVSVAIANSVAVDKWNNIYVTGYFGDTTTIGTTTLKTIYGNNDVFLAKYDPNGNVLWAVQSTIPSRYSSGTAFGIAVDKNGNTFITGKFIDTISFGSVSLIAQGTAAFIVKYDPNGNVLWARQSVAPSAYGYGYGTSITTDNYGNAFVTGCVGDTIIFGTYLLKANIYSEAFFVKYDSNGNVLLATQTHSLDNVGPLGWSIASDTIGGVYLTVGEEVPMSTTRIVYQNDTFSANNTTDATLILKLDYSGNLLCGTFLPTGSDDQNGIASDPQGDYVYFGSDLTTEMILGTDTLDTCCGELIEQTFVCRWQACNNNIISCDSARPFCDGLPVVISGNTSILAGDSTVLTAIISGNGIKYQWSTGATTSSITVAPIAYTTYSLQVIDSGGCLGNVSIAVGIVEVPCNTLFIPDAFSPNGDGQNDILYVRGACINTMDFVVYDRWGNKVFESENINDGWDGTYKGQAMNTGTYVWYLTATMQDGSTVAKKGNVALVR